MKSIDKYVWVVNYTISKTVLQAIQKEILWRKQKKNLKDYREESKKKKKPIEKAIWQRK